jgi:Iap family predicted aminopeptidase
LIILNAFKTNAFDIQRKIQCNEITLEQLAEMTDEDINEDYYSALKKKKIRSLSKRIEWQYTTSNNRPV